MSAAAPKPIGGTLTIQFHVKSGIGVWLELL